MRVHFNCNIKKAPSLLKKKILLGMLATAGEKGVRFSVRTGVKVAALKGWI